MMLQVCLRHSVVMYWYGSVIKPIFIVKYFLVLKEIDLLFRVRNSQPYLSKRSNQMTMSWLLLYQENYVSSHYYVCTGCRTQMVSFEIRLHLSKGRHTHLPREAQTGLATKQPDSYVSRSFCKKFILQVNFPYFTHVYSAATLQCATYESVVL